MRISRSPSGVATALGAVVAAVCGVLLTAGPAHAGCHAFTVTADPSEPGEGVTVTLTIERDNDVQPSSVRVRTVDETATGGSDFTPLDERVEFTTGTEETREIDILDDDLPEDDETFAIELSEGEGCEVNQSFTYGSATVTIQDDDAATEDDPPAPEPSPDVDQGPDQAVDSDLPDTGAGPLAGLGLGALAAAAVMGRRRHP